MDALAAEATPLGAAVREALAVIDRAVSFYGEEALALSFNGGKDCTVLLHLYAAVLAKRRRQGTAHRPTHASCARPDDVPLSPTVYSGFPSTGLGQDPAVVGEPAVRAVYVFQPDPFSEVEAFLDTCATLYNLRIAKICTPSMRTGLELFLQQEPDVRAIMVGTRRSDPYSVHLKHFSMTDNGWPSFMRVNPIIDWSYEHVWQFLRQLDVPYCSLYDSGFTSLGSRTLTARNPALQRADGTFSPAYELSDGALERAGRNVVNH